MRRNQLALHPYAFCLRGCRRSPRALRSRVRGRRRLCVRVRMHHLGSRQGVLRAPRIPAGRPRADTCGEVGRLPASAPRAPPLHAPGCLARRRFRAAKPGRARTAGRRPGSSLARAPGPDRRFLSERLGRGLRFFPRVRGVSPRHEVDCKPGPVPTSGCPLASEDHSSRRRVATPLERSHPDTGATRTDRERFGRVTLNQCPYSSLLPEGLASPPVTRLSRVGSYPTISPLPVRAERVSKPSAV